MGCCTSTQAVAEPGTPISPIGSDDEMRLVEACVRAAAKLPHVSDVPATALRHAGWRDTQWWPCQVTRIIDGDTLKVQTVPPREAALLHAAAVRGTALPPRALRQRLLEVLQSTYMAGGCCVTASVRLIGIDAPEISKAAIAPTRLEKSHAKWLALKQSGQSTSVVSHLEHRAGQVSKAFLARELPTRRVHTLLAPGTGLDVDCYGRLLADICPGPTRQDTAALGRRMLAAGMVRAYDGRAARSWWDEQDLRAICRGAAGDDGGGAAAT